MCESVSFLNDFQKIALTMGTVPEYTYGNSSVWPTTYRHQTYDVMVFTENGHYYAMTDTGNIFCIDSPTACIQEAINYVLSKPTGGKVYIRAGDYYLAPLNTMNCGYADICATIPYNEALIVEGDGDATRIHLPQNNLNNQAWLFSWGWNGTAPYTRKSKLRNIAFINDVNAGSYAMNVLVTSASTNNSSGLEVDGVSVYDIQGTALGATFWINNLYDVTFSRYRFFSVNSNKPNTAVSFDSVTLGKIVDSFMFTVNNGNSAISNGTGSIQVDSTEIYGNWSYAFNFGSTDGESNIDVTNSIIGVNRGGSQGIQGYPMYTGPSFLVFNSGNGTVKFSVVNSHLITASINANSSTNNMYVLMRDNYIDGPLGIANLNSSGGGYLYLDVEDNVFQGNNVNQLFNPVANIGANAVLSYSAVIKRNKFYLLSPNNPIVMPSSGSLVFEDNDVYISGTFLITLLNIVFSVSGSGVYKIINNKFYFQTAPSSSTAFYLAANGYSTGTYYLPGGGVVFKGNVVNLPTTNVTWGGFVGSAGSTIANPNALFVDLDNTFNLSGVNLPYPSTTTPSVPASGSAQQNTYPYPVEVYVSGGSATAVQVTRGGVTYTVWSSSTATAISPLLVRLEPGDSITITYSTAPSWTWVPAKYIR